MVMLSSESIIAAGASVGAAVGAAAGAACPVDGAGAEGAVAAAAGACAVVCAPPVAAGVSGSALPHAANAIAAIATRLKSHMALRFIVIALQLDFA